jgi:proteic killer suppression protein
MDVEFHDKALALIETNRAAETRLPISVINSCRDKLGVIKAAPDERTLRNWKSLHYEKLDGDRSGQRSIRLNKQWRMVFKINTESSPPKITVLSIEDTIRRICGSHRFKLG